MNLEGNPADLLLDGVKSSKAFDATPFLRSLAGVLAEKHSVSPALHDCDHIMGHLIGRISHPDEASRTFEALQHYFANGADNAEQIRKLMSELGLDDDASVLEFAAGYGRVTRHLKGLNLVSSDIHPDAVAFISESLGVKAIGSDKVPERWKPTQAFDLIFAISLWSHLPDGLFQRWLTAACAALNPGGYLMFTTHGAEAAAVTPQFAELISNGRDHGYLDGSDQKDLDSSIYGSTIVLPSYVIKAIYAATSARIVSFKPAAWWGLQDEWVVRVP